VQSKNNSTSQKEKFLVHINGVSYVKWLLKDDTVQMTVRYLVFKVNLYFICRDRY
jgi:hypothetical protein